jgi:HEAT repeat protein
VIRHRWNGLAAFVLATVASSRAWAQGSSGHPGHTAAGSDLSSRGALPAFDPLEGSTSLRDRFGIELAARLLRSTDPEDRLRALERAASLGTPEGISLLVHAVKDPLGTGRFDPRALLLIARGVAGATSQGEVRQLLRDGILDSSVLQHAAAGSAQEAEGADKDARLDLARSIAAFALATSPDPRAIEAVILVARDAGPGQAAAAEALAAFPPQRVATVVTGPWSPPLLRLAANLGDLRVLDSVRTALSSSDPPTRAAALDAVSELGDTRAIDAARSAAKDADPRVREAGARALVRLGAPDRARAVEALLGDIETAKEGARLAALVSDDGVAKALAARVSASSDPEVRAAAIVALGRSPSTDAVRALAELVKNPLLEGDAAEALARSPNAAAETAIEALVRSTPTRRLGARACAVRAFTQGHERAACTTTLQAMAASRDTRERAVGLSALVLLGLYPAKGALADGDAAVRRAVAMAALADGQEATRQTLLATARRELDAVTRRVMAGGLLDADANGLVPTTALFERTLAGEDDAPLAALALAARADPAYREHVRALFASSDPLLRSHVARGLGQSREPDATGQLAEAYPFEADPSVRRAIVLALAERTQDRDAPARLRILRTARQLDPDGATREASARALASLPASPPPNARFDVAWVRLATREGIAPSGPSFTGALLRSDGLAVPIAFDEDGYALVPIPQGDARLLLAPRLPAYDASAR